MEFGLFSWLRVLATSKPQVVLFYIFVSEFGIFYIPAKGMVGLVGSRPMVLYVQLDIRVRIYSVLFRALSRLFSLSGRVIG